MVAITVILAAVIGTFVIGLGDDLGSTAPSASFDAELNDSGDISDGDALVFFTHRSGDSIDGDNVDAAISNSTFQVNATHDGTIRAGTTVEAVLESGGGDGDIPAGTTVSLVFDDGDRSTTLRSYDLPRDVSTVE